MGGAMSNQHQQPIHLGFNHDIARPPTTLGFLPQSSNPYNDLIKSASLYLRADQPDGKPFTKLEPRTLPNGVSNGEYLQNVSGDVVIIRDMFSSVNDRGGFVHANLSFSLLPFIPTGAIQGIQGTFAIDNFVEVAARFSGGYNGRQFSTETSSGGRLMFELPPGTTLEQAKDILAGTIIRYQLATPIDTLNVPFKNPWTDLKGVVRKNIVDPILIEINRYVNWVNGAIVSSVNLFSSGFCDVESLGFVNYLPGSRSGTTGMAFYDANKNFILGRTSDYIYDNSGVIPVPENAKFARFSFYYSAWTVNNAMVSNSATPLPYEPYGKTNCLLQAFAGTSADGYTVETINGKTNTYISFDGLNSFGQFANMDVLNPVGSDDFCQMVVFRPDILTGFLYWGLSRNTDTVPQYGISNNGSGGLQYIINGITSTALTTNDTNLKYALFGRINGRRFSVINNIETHDAVYTDSIISRPNTQLACRSNSVDGLTKTNFSKGLQGDIAFWKGPQGTLDKGKIVDLVKKAMKQKYNLGV
jgi:hypothetical protein